MSSRAFDVTHPGRVALCVVAVAVLACASGCVSMDLPEPFVVLDRGTSELKAVTPDDARVWVRERPAATNTSLTFWSKVLENEFVQNRGYTLVEGPKETRDGSGIAGKEYVFEATVEGAPQRYLLAVFVYEGRACGFLWPWKEVCTIEFVAPKETFPELVGGVRKGIETLDP